jgi:outer membrane lipoprotein carrier protein
MKRGSSGYVQYMTKGRRERGQLMKTCRICLATAVTMAAVWLSVQARTHGSGTPALSVVVERLQKHYENTTSFSAKFSEEIIPVGGMKREREGVVYYARPGRMRWEFGAPEEDLIVSDGTMLYNYQPDLGQVVEIPVKQAFRSSSATAFLLGMGNLKHDFDVSAPADAPADGLVHLNLAPKSGGDSIELGLDPDSYDIVTLRLADQLGNVTSLKFSAIRNGVALEPGLFTFKAPAGVDIVQPPASP